MQVTIFHLSLWRGLLSSWFVFFPFSHSSQSNRNNSLFLHLIKNALLSSLSSLPFLAIVIPHKLVYKTKG
jgi:hypothetical protein